MLFMTVWKTRTRQWNSHIDGIRGLKCGESEHSHVSVFARHGKVYKPAVDTDLGLF